MHYCLSVDISDTTIHSLLFEKQAGIYAFIGQIHQPFDLADPKALIPAFQASMRELETKCGVALLDKEGNLAHAGQSEQEGISAVGFSFSGGKPVNVGLIGISEAYSMSSLRRLVSLFDAEVILEINLQAPQSQSQQLQALSEANIDLLTIAGGSQEGASRALRGAIENTRLFYHLMPKSIQPQIVYAGNQILADYARIEIEAGDDFHLAPNLQNPAGIEDLSVAWKAMLRAYERVRLQQYPQLQDLQAQLKAPLLPASFAMGRLARFIARLSTTDKSVLLVDQSAAKTTLVLANKKQLMCVGKAHHVDEGSIQKTRDFCSQPLSINEVATYLHNKALFPEHLGLTISDFAIEQAWSRANVWQALGAMKAIYPTLQYDALAGFSEACDPIILSGSRFTEHLKAHQILSIALDSIMPHGISTIAVDENHILRAVGTLAESEPLLVVQMLELESFRNLASVVAIENLNYEDQVLLELEIETKDKENRSYYRVDRGQLRKIDTAGGDGVRVYLAPTRSSDVGMGMIGLGGWISVPQTEQGLVVDGRGRPLNLPDNAEARAKTWRDWLWGLGV